MHELSLTLALLDEVDTVVRREGATRVTSVSVRVGRQSAIACEALAFAWDVARLGTIASAADLCIEQVEGRAFDLVGLELR
jgi:hydrogenase nickel incorporation protein HypA/HybF